ncbi:S-layer homology domain-containing protein [Paenibacillaceae bacterium WGS1546]|uniref:S-layer homology domain-containing protein n=1 Tax=Cohnella sp. WGS1546 TaxID=3366810 RepID=UPI00372D7798
MGGSKARRVRGWLLCTLLIVHSLFGFPNLSIAQSFSDTESHWAGQEIKQGVADGWINGYPDGSFQPDRSISRAEMVSLFQRAGGFSAEADVAQQIRFTDVAPNAWYSDAIYAAAAAGILYGFEDGSMRPDRPVSRQEAAVMMARMAQLEANEAAAAKFSDALPAWSKGHIGASAAAGWIKGYPDGSFRPNQLLTRAEAVVILSRYLEAPPSSNRDLVFDTEGAYGPATGRMSVEGNVVVDAAKVTLQNMDIAGNLIFTDKLGAGDAVVRNVRVTGTALVHGGGEQSIHVRDSDIKALTVDKKGSRVRILASGSSVIPTTTLLSSAILEENEVTGTGFEHVVLSKSKEAKAESESEARLRGSFDTATLISPQWKLSLERGAIHTLRIAEGSGDSGVSLEDGTKVDLAVIEKAAIFSGKGIIKKAELKANEIRFDRNPKSVSCVSGVTHALCQQPTSSSGGSSSPRPTPTPTPTVTALVYEPQQARLSYLGQEIQAEVTARWSDGTTKEATSEALWRSQDPDVATVSGTGTIRAVGEGLTYVEATYRGHSVQIPVEVRIPSSVIGAYRVEAHLAQSTPVAGETNALRLVVQRSDGSTDTAFSGLRKVVASGFSTAPDGTIGQWNGVSIDDAANEYEVDFTAGEAGVDLILHHAEAQTLVFAVADVVEPEARKIVTPSSAEAQTAILQTQPSLDAVSGERMAEQPVVVLLDRFRNIATNSALVVTASLSGSDAGSASLHGTTVIPAVNGIASYTDLYLQGRGTGVTIAFVPAGLAGVNSDPISIKAPFAGGSGTASDPYLVATAEQLNEVRYDLGAHFLQTEDIDLSAARYSAGEGWEPIGEGKIAPNGSLAGDPFTGTFDGGGNTIRHLTIQSQRGWSGLFGYIRNAELRNIHLENLNIEASHYSGGLVGHSIESNISDSSVKGEVSGTTVFGGLVGYSLEGSIKRSSAEVRLSATQASHDQVIPVTGYIGGLVGGMHSGLIADSYSRGRLVTDGDSYTAVGGLVGYSDQGTIRYSYAAVSVEGDLTKSAGGLAGGSDGAVYTSAYYDQEIAGLTDTGKGTPLSTERMRTQASFMDWKFDETWAIVEGCGYPYLKGLSEADLSCFKAGLGPEGTSPVEGIPFEVRLTEAQDAAGQSLNKAAAVVVTWKEGNESLFGGEILFVNGEARIPITIGTAGLYTLVIQIADIAPAKSIAVTIAPAAPPHPFAGGAGTEADPYGIETAEQLDAVRQYLQSHFKLNNDINLNVAPYNQGEGWQPIGTYRDNFKGSFDGGGHTITGLTINRPSTDTNVGLFGFVSNSAIRNLHLKDVQVASEGHGVGGLAGTIWYGTVENVSVQGTVSSTGALVGGVVGDFARGTMRYVYADISVEGELNVGGIVGYVTGEGYGATIERSYSRGTVKATENAVGGVAGWIELDCVIADSYSLAEIIGRSNTGGVVGSVQGEVRNVYAAGRVTNEYNDPGGIAGFVGRGKVTGSYYDRQTTTRSDYGNGDPKTTTDMKRKSTFVNWDFSEIWSIDEGSSYPYLQWPDSM